MKNMKLRFLINISGAAILSLLCACYFTAERSNPDDPSGLAIYFGSAQQVTDTANNAMCVSMVWTGTEYGIAWEDSRNGTGNPEIWFARVGADGTMTGSEVRMSSDSLASYNPSLVWTGTEYGLAWYEYDALNNRNIRFARISAEGVMNGSEVAITTNNSATNPSLVWTGSEYGLAWQDNRDTASHIYFCRMDLSGVKQDSDVCASDASTTSDQFYAPSLAWSGTEYAAVYRSSGTSERILFARLNTAGVVQDRDIQIASSTGDANYPDIVWNGSGYGVAWQETSGIRFARVSSTGVVDGDSIWLTTTSLASRSVSLAWTGSEYGVSWYTEDNEAEHIFFTRISAEGAMTGSPIAVTCGVFGAFDPSLVWNENEDEFALAWCNDNDTGNGTQVFFSQSD